MSRKRCHRRVVVPVPPRGLRPRLASDQVLDLALVHITNLDTIAKGQGTEETLWQWVGGALTWSHVAAELQRHQPDRFAEASAAMLKQLEICTAVIERFGRHRRVVFAGLEYQQAKDACSWMDALAEVVDRHTAIAAAEWSEKKVSELASACGARQAEATKA